MGGVNDVLETMSAGVAMLINGDAGDISPGEHRMEIIFLVHHNVYNCNTL